MNGLPTADTVAASLISALDILQPNAKGVEMQEKIKTMGNYIDTFFDAGMLTTMLQAIRSRPAVLEAMQAHDSAAIMVALNSGAEIEQVAHAIRAVGELEPNLDETDKKLLWAEVDLWLSAVGTTENNEHK